MKTIRKNTIRKNTLVRRVSDSQAVQYVKFGEWEYCPKSVWKNAAQTESPKLRMIQ